MDKCHRERITNSSSNLKTMIDFEKLKPKLEESKLFFGDMLFDITNAGQSDTFRNEMLLKYLPKRGPNAYNKFIRCLIDSGQVQVARVLEDTLPDTSLWEGEVVKATAWPSTTRKTYRMKNNPRGVVLIVSNTVFENDNFERRVGGEVDERNLQRLFVGLGFLVDLHKNKSRGELLKILSDFQRDERHSAADASIVIILSHGGHRGFYCSDNAVLSNEVILNMFNNANCAPLQSKPKLFLFQHCRGDEVDYAIPKRCVPDAVPMPKEVSLASFSDVKICYSTCPSFYSMRCEEEGTWFISTLVETFSKCAHDTDLDTMLRDISARMAKYETLGGWKQTPEYTERGWRFSLYFNPGLFE